MKIMPPGPPLLPNILYGQPPRVLAATTITHEMDNLAISNNTNISSSPVVPSSEVKVHYIYHLFKRWQWDLSISVVYIAVFIWTHSNYVYEKPSRRCRIQQELRTWKVGIMNLIIVVLDILSLLLGAFWFNIWNGKGN